MKSRETNSRMWLAVGYVEEQCLRGQVPDTKELRGWGSKSQEEMSISELMEQVPTGVIHLSYKLICLNKRLLLREPCS